MGDNNPSAGGFEMVTMSETAGQVPTGKVLYEHFNITKEEAEKDASIFLFCKYCIHIISIVSTF